MVQVYVLNISRLPDPKECINERQQEILQELPQEEIEKILQFSHVKGRKQCLGARVLQKYILGLHGLTFSDVTYGEYGKPEVKGIHFNLSHSHDYVVCVVSKRAVGCDIEKIQAVREGVAKRFFHENETAHLKKYSGEEKDVEFVRLWTMKESYLKMTGEGMHLPMNQFACVISEDGVRVLHNEQDVNCYIKEYEVPGYKLTVCAKESTFAEDFEVISGLFGA